jgi:hypothetical protein
MSKFNAGDRVRLINEANYNYYHDHVFGTVVSKFGGGYKVRLDGHDYTLHFLEEELEFVHKRAYLPATADYVSNLAFDNPALKKYTKEAQRLADDLFNAFYWGNAAEGFDFWQAVHQRLTQIARGELYEDLDNCVDPNDWLAEVKHNMTTVGHMLAAKWPHLLPHVADIGRGFSRYYAEKHPNAARLYVKSSKKEREGGCEFVRAYPLTSGSRYFEEFILSYMEMDNA